MNLSPSSSAAADIVRFVDRRCAVLNYEPTFVRFDADTVQLESLTQFPVGVARGTVAVASGASLDAVLRSVADLLDAMHAGVTQADLREVGNV